MCNLQFANSSQKTWSAEGLGYCSQDPLIGEFYRYTGGIEFYTLMIALSLSGDAVTTNCPSVERELWPRKQNGSCT